MSAPRKKQPSQKSVRDAIIVAILDEVRRRTGRDYGLFEDPDRAVNEALTYARAQYMAGVLDGADGKWARYDAIAEKRRAEKSLR